MKKILLLSVLLFGLYYFFKGEVPPWYSAYSGPMVIQEHGGSKYKTPFYTLIKLNALLSELEETGEFSEEVLGVRKKGKFYGELLLESYKNCQDKKVDFIASMHATTYTNDSGYLGEILSSQKKVLNVLTKENYPLIGKEGAWSKTITEETIREENFETLKKSGVERTAESEQKLNTLLRRSKDSDAVLQYQDKSPIVVVTGIEDRELFLLHQEIAGLYYTLPLTSPLRARYKEYDRVLVWFRTEIAIAKMLGYMKESNIKHSVIVMGQSHLSQFEKIAKELGLITDVHHLVSKDYQGEAN